MQYIVAFFIKYLVLNIVKQCKEPLFYKSSRKTMHFIRRSLFCPPVIENCYFAVFQAD